MKVLVTGLHRSGTSATAVYLATVSGLKLLDDPQWAIFEPDMGRAYRRVPAYRQELDAHPIVKCPRLGECLQEVLEDFPDVGVVYVVRDPREVYCSVLEAQSSGDPTVSTMANNLRFGAADDLLTGVSLSYLAYAKIANDCASRHTGRITFASYLDVYNAPDRLMAALCRKLGIPAAGEFPYAWRDKQLAPLRNKHPDRPEIKGPGRWRVELSETDSNRILQRCGSIYEQILKRCIPPAP